MILRCGVSLKFGIAPAFPFGQRELTPIPVLVPQLRHPTFRWSVIRSSCSSCSIYSPNGPFLATIGRTNTCSKRRAAFGFWSWRLHNREFLLEGVNTGSDFRFSIPKVNGFDTALTLGWEVAALRLFRCSSFSQQGAVTTLSFVLAIGSEVRLGRRASAAAPRGCGLAPAGRVMRHI